jgi:hypothetical protein
MPRSTPRRRADPPPAVHVVAPTGIYTVDEARQIFRLRQSTIRREVREGRLRISKRAGRYYLLGRWLIEWLEAGEVRRKTGATAKHGERCRASGADT